LKCSEKTPRVARAIRELCREAGLLDDLVQVVDGPPDRATALLDAGPDIVFFTGSSDNGRLIAERAAQSLIPAVLELGGKDAAVIFADCNLERTIEGVTYGAFANAGQVCVGIKRLYDESSLFETFLPKLVELTRRLRIGSTPEADIGVLQGDAARARLLSQVDDAVQRGATLHHPDETTFTG
jgi:acyl-CoA reductase-like NAD-dependent aldehyde dehydrogenase